MARYFPRSFFPETLCLSILFFMNIERIVVGAYEVNCCIVWGDAKQALIIDPGYDAPRIATCIDAQGLSVVGYLLTHSHPDHVNALAELCAERPAPVWIHSADFEWVFSAANQLLPNYPVPERPNVKFIHPEVPTLGKSGGESNADGIITSTLRRQGFGGQEGWEMSDLFFQCLETPGHSTGGVCYWFEEEGVCFTGDTLFKGSCGRVDHSRGDAAQLKKSLRTLMALPPETRIVPGHGAETTLAHELKTNPFLRRAIR